MNLADDDAELLRLSENSIRFLIMPLILEEVGPRTIVSDDGMIRVLEFLRNFNDFERIENPTLRLALMRVSTQIRPTSLLDICHHLGLVDASDNFVSFPIR